MTAIKFLSKYALDTAVCLVYLAKSRAKKVKNMKNWIFMPLIFAYKRRMFRIAIVV